MQSRIFPTLISSRTGSGKTALTGCRRSALSLVALLAFALTGDMARAQVTNPTPPTEQPSQKNPAPRAGGDAQNRNRAHDDKYWGFGDSNRRWFENPYSRIPDPGAVARGNGYLVADGWQFPQSRPGDDSRRVLDFGGGPADTIPGGALPAGDGVRYFAAPWATATTPSTNALGDAGTTDNEYQRTPAVPRLATAIPNLTLTPASYAQTTVKWFPNISGAANVLRRFTIRIYLPTPEPFPTDGSLAAESRIDDARYVVHFHVRVGGVIVKRTRTLLRAQSGGGWVTLTDSNNQPILFTMATEATGLTGENRARVELDNTTEGPSGIELVGGTNRQRFVIADQIQFVPSSEYGEIKAPTTVTPVHGGRKLDPAAIPALGDPYDPARNLFQPSWTAQPTATPFVTGLPAGTSAFGNDSFDFINNPRQVTDPIYTLNTLAYYQPFEPWNPSTLFQGPRSLIDDQTDTTVAGREVGIAPALRTNQQRYANGGNPIPLFSHMQVLVPRTEYVPDPNSTDGLGSIAVGCVYGVDWLTGTPLWRFPDRTHLPRDPGTGVPGNVGSYVQPGGGGVTVIRSGSRNPNITVDGVTVAAIPGIGAFDKNGDGYIGDDEVFIVGQGDNPSGGIEAGITLVPRNYTRGAEVNASDPSDRTTVPVYDDAWNPYTSPTSGMNSNNPNATSIATDLATVPVGRYSGPDAAPDTYAKPVEAGMALVAANNGVIYAIDPYGNNDNRYYNFSNSGGVEDTTRFGTFRNGSTNAFWTFSVTAPVRLPNESTESYNRKLKQSVPATGPWGRSTPVIAYAKDENDPTLNRFLDEPRLFIGNANGVLYAINAVSDAGRLVDVNPDPMITDLEYRFGTFPFRKEAHLTPTIGNRQPDLRWWFETEAAINAAPAVSPSIHPQYTGQAAAAGDDKAVYVTSNDGRVYSVDWSGPVTKGAHNTNLNYTGITNAAQQASAEALNDNVRFHNTNPVTEFAVADGTEGTVRPRWVFPSRYRDIDGNDDNSELAPIQPADISNVIAGARVERQTRLAPINSAPSVMDFPYDSDPSAGVSIQIKRYVAVVANDLNGSDGPVRGRVYLLDQVGDRRDFSVKPVERTAAVTGGDAIAFGQPEDMYAPTEYVFSDATPAWTYRPVYRRYTDAGVTEDIPLRNRPTELNNVLGGTPTPINATGPAGPGLAEKRVLPTLFVGGPIGRLFALDIDPDTGLFLRWRGSIAATRALTPLPASFTDAANLPVNEPVARRLSPPNPVLAAISVGVGTTTLNDRPPLVRTIAMLGTEDVSSITVSGGPQQNRNHPFATAAPVDGPTVPGLPTNDTPSLLYPGVPFAPNPLTAGTVPTTGVRPPYWTATNVANAGTGTALDFTGFDPIAVPSFDFTGRFVNQDHDDPTATTRGTNADPRTATVDPSVPLVTVTPEANRAYQQPILAVTTTDGSFTLVSTELEGVDSVNGAQGTDTEALLGWGLTSDPRLANGVRSLLMSRRGPGGAGTQVAMITNAHYGAMDPGFRNTVQKQAGSGATPADPTAADFQYYPWYEPRNPGVVNTPPYGDPRPRFEPRSLYSGNTANANGPDGIATTGDGWPEIKADAHTGRTGFPLDLRGLFFDKRFAANPTATVAATNTNDDGLLRLPAYSGIGEALTAGDRRARLSQTYRIPSPLTPPVALADGTPDTPRDSSTGATAPWRTNPNDLFPGEPVTFPTLATSGSEADINPPGTNIAWLFVGGSDGVFYSYTPNRFSVPGAGGGLGTGFVGGGENNNPGQNEGQNGNAKLMLVSKATYDNIVAGARRPVPADDLLQNGGKPFFEYGESVYAVIYDIGPNPGARVDTDGDGLLEELNGEVTFPTTINIAFRPYNGTGGRAPGANTTATVLVAAPVVTTFRYPFDAATQTNRPQNPALVNAPVSERAIALLQVQINTNFNEGGGGGGRRANLSRAGGGILGWTPGAVYEMSANGFSGGGVGATAAESLANQQPLITVANPLAIQAFLLSNVGGGLATVADPLGGTRVYNNIGPFFSDSGGGIGSVKDRVASTAGLATGNTALLDPDRRDAEYNQALANGNRVSRFDLIPFGTGGAGTRNPNYGKPLVSTAAGVGIEATFEPTFYLPVAASAGMIDHGKPGSTNVTGNRKTLRIVNRSLQGSLSKLRVELRSDALFRSWPGDRPHVRPNDGSTSVTTTIGAVTVPTRGTGNFRRTPVDGTNVYRMRPDGVVNFLPWEQPVFASLPWERDSASVGVAASQSNTSRDYPDIAAQSEAASSQQIVRVVTGSGDLLRSNGTLSASVSGTANLTVSDNSITTFAFAGNNGNFAAASAEVQIAVPKFQPANLVAMHSLTSTYVKPSADEAPGDASADGDIQLPRLSATGSGLDRAFNDRGLRAASGADSAGANDSHTITPMGYTLQMRAYIDANGDGNHDATEPYRDFETWFGVPVDVSLKQGENNVSLPGATGAAFAHGTAQQNGYMGYGLAAPTAPGGLSVGFLPPFLQDTNVPGLLDSYNGYFAPVTVLSESNVNLWNVRASQKIEEYNNLSNAGNSAGDGDTYRYFAMQSLAVEPRFGILSVEADPNPTGIMPNVVTSLDRKFDATWNAQFNSAAAARIFGEDYNPLRIPVSPLAGAPTRYQAYYAQFGGRHTLHKPTPGSAASVLSVPDVPAASLPASVSPGPTGADLFPPAGAFLPPVQGAKPYLGIAVPLGTPTGRYSNNESGTPLAFFEDHDTQLLTAANAGIAGYSSLTLPATGTSSAALVIDPAGPLYNNQNLLHPGMITTTPVLPVSGEGILRPRRVVGTDNNGLPIYEYLPSTTVTTNNNGVGFKITVDVKESALTGQIADQALSTNPTFPISVVNGVLPGVDNAPLFDYTNIGVNETARPISSLAPAAYRTAFGNLILFHNSNASAVGNVRTGDARPGAPFNLFRSQLTWNAAQGTWVAANVGAPITGAQLFTPLANTGGWFSAPTQLSIGNAPNESNLSPFVLHDPLVQSGLVTSEATLFVMNVLPTSAGESQYTPYFASLGTTGTPGAFISLLPRTDRNRIDASVRRFRPRAVYVSSAEAAFVMYYGGAAGTNNILYVAAPANGNGGLTGPGTREIALRLPASVTSASDPVPVVRLARIAQNAQNVWVYSAAVAPQYVVDVYYTAVLRSGGSADICVSRYRITGSGVNARLQPIDMPKQFSESLTSVGRAPVYRSKHIGWYNRLDADAPLIEVVNTSAGTVTYRTDATAWQLDNASKLLFQQMRNTGGVVVPNLLVYVDTSAGVVTFRGPNAPSPSNTNLAIRATYLPLAYRVAATDSVESSTFGFMDRRPVDTTLALPASGVTNDNGNTLGWFSYGVQTRYNNWDATGGAGIDRQWLYWQRSGEAALPARLFTTTRRIGVDLKAIGEMTTGQSLKLSPNGGGSVAPSQFVVGSTDAVPISVQVGGVNIPFEVDYAKGRIYTQASYEGLQVTISAQKGVFNPPTVTEPGTPFTREATLSPVDEIVGGADTVGQEVPSNRRVNENQPYAFLDLFDARNFLPPGGRVTPPISPDLYPVAASDPALQPGKVWLFWSSSQGRSGLARVPNATYNTYFGIPIGEAITISGYDLFWQTLAPNFNYPSFTGFR